MKNSIWIIGAGDMAGSYASVLKDMNLEFRVIGRGEKSASKFEKSFNISVHRGGLSSAIELFGSPSKAIICVGIESLAESAKNLLYGGTKSILLEKPGSLYFSELKELQLLERNNKANVFIAYNRRFYASVFHLKKLLDFDGGITSLLFEFTEWSHLIKNMKFGKGVKDRWLLSNSSHVIDLAFFLIGLPKKESFSAFQSGKLIWHNSSARFNGAGVSENGIHFSYMSDWESAGRWSLEIMTKKNRYLLKPMETLQKIKNGDINSEFISIDDSLDKKYKPGIYKQLSEFIFDKKTNLCTLTHQVEAFPFYAEIGGYDLK